MYPGTGFYRAKAKLIPKGWWWNLPREIYQWPKRMKTVLCLWNDLQQKSIRGHHTKSVKSPMSKKLIATGMYSAPLEKKKK